MSDLLSSITGGGGGGGSLIFTQQTLLHTKLTMKDGSSVRNAAATAFYTAIDTISNGQQGVILSPAGNMLEQTVVDITGASGVLTNVIVSPNTLANSVVIARITVDGVLHTFTDSLPTINSTVMLLGDRVSGRASTTSGSTAITYGNGGDQGFESDSSLLLPPHQVIERGVSGMVFNDSLKVTIQSPDSNFYPAVRSAATYVSPLPTGL